MNGFSCLSRTLSLTSPALDFKALFRALARSRRRLRPSQSGHSANAGCLGKALERGLQLSSLGSSFCLTGVHSIGYVNGLSLLTLQLRSCGTCMLKIH